MMDDGVLHIRRSTEECLLAFKRCAESPALSDKASGELQSQLGRLKIWAGSIGVFANGKASADHRLHEDEDVRDIMLGMLDRVRSELKKITTLPTLVEDEEDEEQGDELDIADEGHASNASSESSLALSLSDASETASQRSITAQFEAQIKVIEETLTRLYRLTAIIRRPVPQKEHERVTRFIEKEHSKEDFDDFVMHIRWQLGEQRHPGISPRIRDRLINAAIFRRKKLLYRRRHQEKLQHGLVEAFAQHLPTTVVRPADAEPITGATPVLNEPQPISKPTPSIKTAWRSNAQSRTEASAVNSKNLGSYAQSVATKVSPSAIIRRSQLDVPPIPKSLAGKEALCPYCSQVVHRDKMGQQEWM